jgi:uncharacterized protein (TIGR02996 family)
MTDGDALRRAVIESPDEDTPRLIYADWLEENGQPERAAFIRAQIEAASAERFGPQARAAAPRAEELLKKHRAAWTAHIRNLGAYFHFGRGFVEQLTTDVSEFTRCAAELFEIEPVQALLLARDTDPSSRASLQPVFEIPQLRRIRRLEFAPRIEFDYDDYEAFTKSSHLDGLTDLALEDNPIHPAWIRDVLLGDRFPALVGLDLTDDTNLGPALVAAFEGAKHRVIRRLNVSRVTFSSDSLRRLLMSPCLQMVEELRLGWVAPQGDTGPMFHLDPGWVLPWEHLAVLDLNGQRLGDEGVRAIARTAEATALRWLGLANNGLGPDAVRALVAAKQLKLFHLDVHGNGLLPAHIEVLKARFPEAEVVG